MQDSPAGDEVTQDELLLRIANSDQEFSMKKQMPSRFHQAEDNPSANKDTSTRGCFKRTIWPWRHLLIVILTPIVLSPLLIVFNDSDPVTKGSMRCAFVMATMVLYWTTESMPIAVTAFLPLFCYPLLGIAKSNEIAPRYFTESTMAFFGSIFIVSALSQANIHRRFALGVMVAVGTQPRWLLAGVMVVPWFLSMWMANTMTTLLLVPIIAGLVDEMRKALDRSISSAYSVISNNEDEAMNVIEMEPIAFGVNKNVVIQHQPVSTVQLLRTRGLQKADADRLEAMLMLSVAYASSIGGIATVLGSPTNMIFKQQADLAFESGGCEQSPLNFLSFSVFALPASAIFIVFAWLWLQIAFCGPRYAFGFAKSPYEKYKDSIGHSVRELWQQLPPMRFRQWAIIVHCLAMIILLVTRQLNNNPLIGWEVIAPGYVKESAVTFLVALSLFVFPGSLPKKDCPRPEPLISWKEVEKDFPIGVLLIIGGGTAAAYGAEKSGLAELLSKQLNHLTAPLSDSLTVFVLVAFVVAVTEVMSNMACVTLMMPIFKRLAQMRHKNPLLFMFPTALGSSFAFMFPVSTPPNAIVFGTGRLRMTQMIGAGSVMNILGMSTLFLATITWGDSYFNFFNELPSASANSSVISNTTICF